MDYKNLSPQMAREMIRDNKLDIPTSGISKGFIQTNLAILPKKDAYDFLLFCIRNPKPCPLIEVLDVGSFKAKCAKNSDIRTDIARYRVYKKGVLDSEVDNLKDLWQDDFIAFLIGCSFSFENALIQKGISIRHIENCKNVAMYLTDIPCEKSGKFFGNMVVSMRPIKNKDLTKAVLTTARFPAVHGAPIHIGNPKFIGIKDITKPDFGEFCEIKDDETPIFWACGVTPQSIAISSKPDIMITHAPGFMFITDKKDEDFAFL